jgi:hypothetical protein
MSDAHASHGANDHDTPHAAPNHGEALGPIDLQAWGAGILGVAIGLAVALCFALAVGVVGVA